MALPVLVGPIPVLARHGDEGRGAKCMDRVSFQSGVQGAESTSCSLCSLLVQWCSGLGAACTAVAPGVGVRLPGSRCWAGPCAGAAAEFDKRMDRITTFWCCRQEQEARERGLQDRIAEQLYMTPHKYSQQQGLDASC